MRVIVTGGRTYGDWIVVRRALRSVGATEVIQGGCPSGADRHAKDWADINKIKCTTFAANWKVHGKAAGPIRNQQMIDAGADLVLAFPGGRGTADCVARAKAAGVPVRAIK